LQGRAKRQSRSWSPETADERSGRPEVNRGERDAAAQVSGWTLRRERPRCRAKGDATVYDAVLRMCWRDGRRGGRGSRGSAEQRGSGGSAEAAEVGGKSAAAGVANLHAMLLAKLDAYRADDPGGTLAERPVVVNRGLGQCLADDAGEHRRQQLVPEVEQAPNRTFWTARAPVSIQYARVPGCPGSTPNAQRPSATRRARGQCG